ncbi:MAG: SPBc2 prophage-derived aminoglycoside N(3')-acetyltransferase-like protein YokD [Lentisphaerae bacterium ADurb.Bin242]|nr:MAG: SPBc2 prophage-derived aminoglycoside N(3')-acetyltransferase-like protein YokD [Lentisphaerae bacterium ADurb.Bin242]
MNSTIERIQADLKKLGVKENDNLLVHASLRSLGEVPGGAETVIRGLLEALGPEGTLLFPTLSYRDVNSDHPVFDVLNTPCCVGALPEYFRKRPGTVRSVCPTHSVSGVGRNAERLLGDHCRDTTPCGPNSPFRKLRELGGWILFIGCGIHPNTSMHAVEELVEPVYLFTDQPVDYRILLPDGSETRMRVRRHNFKGWAQAYARLDGLMDETHLRQGKVLEADCQLMDVKDMWEKALAALKENPLYFVRKLEEGA